MHIFKLISASPYKIFLHQIITLEFFINSRIFKMVKADFSGVKNEQKCMMLLCQT